MRSVVKVLVPAVFLNFGAPAIAETLPPAMSQDYSSMVETATASNIGLVRNGNSADNKLGGTNLKDAFNGGEGNDLLVGYGEFDTYSFDAGDGADVIVDLSPTGNRIRFLDVDESWVGSTEVLGFNGETDRLITYGEGDAIRIVGWSRMSEETRAAWIIEHVFRPKQEPYPERPSPLRMLLSDPKSVLMIVLLLVVGLYPAAKLLMRRR